MDTPLNDALRAVLNQNRVRMHVPFHAGHAFCHEEDPAQSWDFRIDLTELPVLDVLGNPQGVLKASQQAVADLYGVRDSFYLVNGASIGLMAAMLACGLGETDTVLVARNAHRSVIHGLVLCGAQPQWVLPHYHPDWGLWGALTVDAVESAIAQSVKKPKALIMTHPTYEGLSSDIPALAACCRRHGMAFIIDEAHGALWPLFDYLPPSAITSGVDAVVHSLHKSGGSLTQGALLHLPHGSGIEAHAVQEALNLLHTTSPSYPLLANMETTLAYWDAERGKIHLQQWHHAIMMLRDWIHTTLQTIQVFDDPVAPQKSGFQLFLKSTRMNGETFATILEEDHDIAFESYNANGILLNLNAGLDDLALDRLKAALSDIDNHDTPVHSFPKNVSPFQLPQMQLTPRQAYFQPGETVSPQQAIGRVSRQVVATCPPGIPVLMSGEIIQPHHRPFLPDQVMVVCERNSY